MPTAPASTAVSCTRDPLQAIDADLLVVPWFQDEPPTAVAGVDAASGGEVGRALSSKEFQAKPFDLLLSPVAERGWHARRLALIGAGPVEGGAELMRKVAAAAGLSARARRVERAAFVVRGKGDVALLAQAAAEGLTLA